MRKATSFASTNHFVVSHDAIKSQELQQIKFVTVHSYVFLCYIPLTCKLILSDVNYINTVMGNHYIMKCYYTNPPYGVTVSAKGLWNFTGFKGDFID